MTEKVTKITESEIRATFHRGSFLNLEQATAILEKLQRIRETGVSWARGTRSLRQNPRDWIPDEEHNVFKIIDELVDDELSTRRS